MGVGQLLQRAHFRSSLDMQVRSLHQTRGTLLTAAEDPVIGAEFISPQEQPYSSLGTSVVFRSRSYPIHFNPARAATLVVSWCHLQKWGHAWALLIVHNGESCWLWPYRFAVWLPHLRAQPFLPNWCVSTCGMFI